MTSSKNLPVTSVIIPCFNSGIFIKEAIESVESHPDASLYEIIVINDGSDDIQTLRVLDELSQKFTVVNQGNQGPAAARNAGIRIAKGKYILPLDSDNRIRPAYLDIGIEILNTHPEVGVVHGNVHFFGEKGIQFKPGPYDEKRMLARNYIDNCAMIRKSVWEELGGYDENRVLIGHEDWDFWLRVGSSQWKFYFVKQVLFDYRFAKASLINQATQTEKYKAMQLYLFEKHKVRLILNYQQLYTQYAIYQYDQQRPFRSFVKYLRNWLFRKK